MRIYPDKYLPFDGEPTINDVQVVSTDEYGLAIVAKRDFTQGELMFRFTGEIISEITQWSLQIEPGTHLEDLYLVGYTTHSCSPNADVNMEARSFTAKRDIKEGDIITMDYGQTEDYLFNAFECKCKSPECRGLIK